MSDAIKKIMDENTGPEEVDRILENFLQTKFDAELKQDLEKDLKQEYQIEKKHKLVELQGKKRSNRWYFIAAIAASLFLFILALNLFSPPPDDAQNLASSFLASAEIYHSGASKGQTDQEEIRMQAINAFNAKKFTESEQFFSQIVEKTEEDVFYSAMASLYDQKFEDAIEKLAFVAAADTPYQTEANWYLAIAHILNKEEAVAKEVLGKMKNSTWNQEKIQKLLKALK